MPKILFIGSGITNALTSALLRESLPSATMVMWDKVYPDEFGGRMSTYRNKNNQTVDLGAQYISVTPDNDFQHKRVYEDLINARVISSLKLKIRGMIDTVPGTTHYKMVRGSSSLITHFLDKAGLEIRFGCCVTEINSMGKQWEVSCLNGVKELFDIVLLSLPVPKIFKLTGDVKEFLDHNIILKKKLEEVKYSSRFALGLFFNRDSNISLPNGDFAEFISGDPVIRFVSIDNEKRGIDSVSPSVVIHTSVSFGKENLDKTTDEIKLLLLNRVKKLYPNWPEPISVICHKWEYSQVLTSYPGSPGAIMLKDGLIAGGDGFIHSGMDGCIKSANAMAKEVLRLIHR